jgi:hypothetical protein
MPRLQTVDVDSVTVLSDRWLILPLQALAASSRGDIIIVKPADTHYRVLASYDASQRRWLDERFVLIRVQELMVAE